MNLQWVTIGDNHVCPDCVSRSGKVQSSQQWESDGLPREGFTVCGDLCRCDLVPVDASGETIINMKEFFEGLSDEQIEVIRNDVIEDLMKRIAFDKGSGQAILMKNFKDVIGLNTLEFRTAAKFAKKFDEVTARIYKYNTTTGPLPDEYYDILTIDGKLEWLKRNT